MLRARSQKDSMGILKTGCCFKDNGLQVEGDFQQNQKILWKNMEQDSSKWDMCTGMWEEDIRAMIYICSFLFHFECLLVNVL